MNPHLIDKLFLVVAAILPIVLIFKWRLKGAIAGAVSVWGMLTLSGVIVSALDPTREGGILDAVWFLFGMVGGLLYCIPIWALFEIVRNLLKLSGQQESHPSPPGTDT